MSKFLVTGLSAGINNDSKKELLTLILLLILTGVFIGSMELIKLREYYWIPVITMYLTWLGVSYLGYQLTRATFYYGGAGWFFQLSATFLLAACFCIFGGQAIVVNSPDDINKLSHYKIERVNFVDINKPYSNQNSRKNYAPLVTYNDGSQELILSCSSAVGESRLNEYSSVRVHEDKLQVDGVPFYSPNSANKFLSDINLVINCLTKQDLVERLITK